MTSIGMCRNRKPAAIGSPPSDVSDEKRCRKYSRGCGGHNFAWVLSFCHYLTLANEHISIVIQHAFSICDVLPFFLNLCHPAARHVGSGHHCNVTRRGRGLHQTSLCGTASPSQHSQIVHFSRNVHALLCSIVPVRGVGQLQTRMIVGIVVKQAGPRQGARHPFV